jgi:hypothetical protein
MNFNVAETSRLFATVAAVTIGTAPHGVRLLLRHSYRLRGNLPTASRIHCPRSEIGNSRGTGSRHREEMSLYIVVVLEPEYPCEAGITVRDSESKSEGNHLIPSALETLKLINFIYRKQILRCQLLAVGRHFQYLQLR